GRGFSRLTEVGDGADILLNLDELLGFRIENRDDSFDPISLAVVLVSERNLVHDIPVAVDSLDTSWLTCVRQGGIGINVSQQLACGAVGIKRKPVDLAFVG